MADRKVLVKYYPPDFDFDKLQAKKKALRVQQQQLKRRRGNVFDPPQKKHRNKIMNVRMMFPFTLKCGTCNEFIYVGTKFNSRVEKVEGEDYLGIIKWRFYGRCPHCRAEVCFKTDPQNCNYVLEWGGTRMCDPLKDQALAEERIQKEQDALLAADRIAQVEASRQGLQAEVLALEQLAELRRLNRRLLDKTAASDAALAFLQENRVRDGDFSDFADAQDWTENEVNELKRFRDIRECDSDPQSSEETVGEGNQLAFPDVGYQKERNTDYHKSAATCVQEIDGSSSSSNTPGSNLCRPTMDNIFSTKRCGVNGSSGSIIEEKEAKMTLSFGLRVSTPAPKLLIVRKPPPQEVCTELFGEYGSSSGEEIEAT